MNKTDPFASLRKAFGDRAERTEHAKNLPIPTHTTNGPTTFKVLLSQYGFDPDSDVEIDFTEWDAMEQPAK